MKAWSRIACIAICFLISHKVQAGAPSIEVLSPYTYSKLSKSSQQKYIKKIQSTWVHFEKKYKHPSQNKTFIKPILFDLLFNTAFAESKQCIIGGNVLAVTTSGERTVCPTTTRKCNAHTDGFECGDIFGKVCINRIPISNLSERCYQESKTLTPSEYQTAVQSMGQNFRTLCGGTIENFTKDGCEYLAKKLNGITSEHHIATYTRPGSSTPTFSGVDISGCSNGTTSSQRKLWVPQFNLLSQNVCAFESNQSILANLTQQGCSKSPETRNLFTTRIQTKNKILLHGQADIASGIIDQVSLIERTNNNNATFTVRMIKHDISRSPLKPVVTTYKVRQKGSNYYLIDNLGVESEVSISNSYRPNFLMENFTALNPSLVFETKLRLADDCRLASDLQALKQNGSYSPSGVSSSVNGRVRTSK